ncbi:MAG: cobalamin-dependent protein [Candidatus Riflebacteria bacterium]|nr:cobalamin-dependent protein [Candidatus Riflebacteria bacterium]
MELKTWVDSLLEAMVNADRKAAMELIERAFAAGISPDLVLSGILDPALGHLGVMWEKTSVSLAQTFIAAKTAEDVLLRCLPTHESRTIMPFKGSIVIGNIEDDFHSLGRRIVASFLRATGWEVHDLGNDVPADQFVDKALEVHASVIGASAMMQTAALNIRKLRDLIDARGLKDKLKLAVGGAVFNWRPELVAEIGGDGTAQSAAYADALFQRLQAEAKKERQS